MATGGGVGWPGEWGGEYLYSGAARQNSNLDRMGAAVDDADGLHLLWWLCFIAVVVGWMAQRAKVRQALKMDIFVEFGV
jgi:hypothetical protein